MNGYKPVNTPQAGMYVLCIYNTLLHYTPYIPIGRPAYMGCNGLILMVYADAKGVQESEVSYCTSSVRSVSPLLA